MEKSRHKERRMGKSVKTVKETQRIFQEISVISLFGKVIGREGVLREQMNLVR